MAADFQNVYRYSVCLCLSVVLADVSEHNYNLAGENELSFVVCICVFFYLHDSGFRRASVRVTSWEKMWMLVAVMDKTLTPSPWTTLMDYPNGLP